MTTVWLDRGRIKGAFREAAAETLDEVGDFIAADARYRAPIRKAFREKPGHKRRFRPLTPLERNLATRRANLYYGQIRPDEFKRRRAVAHIKSYAKVELPHRGSMNALANSRRLRRIGKVSQGRFRSLSGAFPNAKGGYEPGDRLGRLLTARGRYEVRSGRAIHKVVSARGRVTTLQIGGALKASIEAGPVVDTARGQEVEVGAYIRYAKFVEFPTVHNAAQPFLLPALHDSRSRLKRVFVARLRSALGG